MREEELEAKREIDQFTKATTLYENALDIFKARKLHKKDSFVLHTEACLLQNTNTVHEL